MIARGVVEGGQRSPWVHMGGGQGSPAVHCDAVNDRMRSHVGGGQGSPGVDWDAVSDRRGCIEMCLTLAYLCSHFLPSK